MKTINVYYKRYILAVLLSFATVAGGCNGILQSNTNAQLFYGLFFTTTPVLNALVITAHDDTSITLAQPQVFMGNPFPTVQAYIGDSTLIANTPGTPTITGFAEGPVDVSAGPYTFNGLAGNTTYRIYVVAQNSSGYSIEWIEQSTGGTAPVLDTLAVTATDDTSITLALPVFIDQGNPSASGPLPTGQIRNAYIGPADGGSPIIVDYLTGAISGTVNETIDVYATTFPYSFSALTPDRAYRIIVVAQNSSGVSIRDITQSTASMAPIMSPLMLTGTTDTSITLQQPGFTTAGNPLPPVQTRLAYIGYASAVLGTPISVDYETGIVSNNIGAAVNVAASGCTFSGLTPNGDYRIIVVAQNSSGLSIREIAQNTAYAGPVMSPLVLTGTTDTSITLQQPGFTTAGNPLPPVQTRLAYIGYASAVLGTPISVDYETGIVSNNIGAAVNVAASGCTFPGLTPNGDYRIIVVAQNASGLSIREIAQNTAYAGPVMSPLVLTGTTDTSITLQQPGFTTAGNPLPPAQTRLAYIGYASAVLGTPISVDYETGIVSNNIGAAVNVAASGCTFSGLTPNGDYRIIVVAQNSSGLSIREIAQNTVYAGPVMSPLVLTGTTDTSITLQQPGFTTAGNPLPPAQTRLAYIGYASAVLGTPISVDYETGIVSNNIGAAVNVAASGCTFSGLTPNGDYRIIVVAQNSSGLSIREIAQNTVYAGPVMSPLVLTGTTDTSITLQQPGFTTAGNPLPPAQTRLAYIGYASAVLGTPISVDYETGIVSNNIGAAVNVAASGCTFPGLTPNGDYRIIVVAQNASGLSIREIAQNTVYAGPVMSPLVLTGTTNTSITLQQPGFTTAGNPLPPVQTRLAYIGYASAALGTPISVNYLTGLVNDYLGAAVDVAAFGCTFSGLTPNGDYRIIVVAQNSSGLSIRSISANTGWHCANNGQHNSDTGGHVFR